MKTLIKRADNGYTLCYTTSKSATRKARSYYKKLGIKTK